MKKFLPLSLLLAAQIATVQSAEVITDATPAIENQTQVAKQPVATSDAQETQKETTTQETEPDALWEATFEHLKAAKQKLKSYEDQILGLKTDYLSSLKEIQPNPGLERMKARLEEMEEGLIEAQQEYTKAYYVHLNTAFLVNKNPGVPACQAPQIEDALWEATFEHLKAAKKKMKKYEDQILGLKKDIHTVTSLNELEKTTAVFYSNTALLTGVLLSCYAIKRNFKDTEGIMIASGLLTLYSVYTDYLSSLKEIQPNPGLERMKAQLKEIEEGLIESQQEYTKAYYVHLNTAFLANKNPGVPAWQAPQIETEKN